MQEISLSVILFLNESELISINTSIAIVSITFKRFQLLLTITILFNITHSFAHC